MEQNYDWDTAFRLIHITYHSTDIAKLLPPVCATHLIHTQLQPKTSGKNSSLTTWLGAVGLTLNSVFFWPSKSKMVVLSLYKICVTIWVQAYLWTSNMHHINQVFGRLSQGNNGSYKHPYYIGSPQNFKETSTYCRGTITLRVRHTSAFLTGTTVPSIAH
jgi:hypothetical protein